MNVPASELMPLVGAALERGQRVRMTVTGGSMLPFLCGGEELEIERASSIRIGDIVIARVGDAYVLHRVVGMDRAGRIFLRGDAQTRREGPIEPGAVLGRFVHGRRLAGRRLAGIVWAATCPVGPMLLSAALALRRVVRAGTRRVFNVAAGLQPRRHAGG